MMNPSLVAWLMLAATAASRSLEPRGCNADNCLRALDNQDYAASAVPFCSSFLATTVTATTAIPTYLANCGTQTVVARVSSACSCFLQTAGGTSCPAASTVTQTSSVNVTVSVTSTLSQTITSNVTLPASTTTVISDVTLPASTTTVTSDVTLPASTATVISTVISDVTLPASTTTVTSDVTLPASTATVISTVISDVTLPASTTTVTSDVTLPASTTTLTKTATVTSAELCTTGVNALGNPGFENGLDNVAPWSTNSGVARETGDNPAPYQGNYYFLLDLPDPGESGPTNATLKQTVNICGTGHYTVSLASYTEGIGCVGVVYLNGVNIGTLPTNEDNGWTVSTFRYTAPSTPLSFSQETLLISLTSTSPVGVCQALLIDSVSLSET